VAKDVAIDPAFADVLAGRGAARNTGDRSTAEAIILAAEELFLEHGYSATRVSDVARLAGVSIGSIYVHYTNKEGLYTALVERALDIEARYLDAALESEELADIEKVISLGEAYLQFFRDHPAHYRLLMLPVEPIPEEATKSPLGRQVMARGVQQRNRLAEIVGNCVRDGLMRDDLDPLRTANFLWAAWNGVIALTMRDDELAIDEHEMEQVVLTGRLMVTEGMIADSLRGPDGRLEPALRTRLDAHKPPPEPLDKKRP
jgi:AcrR family transcriptional regulator